MTPQEYIRRLNEQKKLAESRFDNLSGVERDMLDAGYSFLLSSLDLKDGLFEVPGNLTKLMDDFVLSIVSISDKSKLYANAFGNYLSDINVIKQNIADFQGTYNRISINTPGIKNVQKAVVSEIIDQYSANGLNKHFATPLRDLIHGNILGGMSQKDAMSYLKDYIIGGEDKSGKLKSYLLQTAQQGVDSYSGAINMKLKKEFDFTGYIISGSIIETSSKQCIEALEMSVAGYLTFEQWKQVLEIARKNPKAKLIDGTTVDNLPLNKLHWGCRHEFTAVIKN